MPENRRVDERHCFFVEPEDDRLLGDAIVRLCRDAGLRKRMGDANRALFIERFHPDAVLARIGGLYAEVLDSRRPGSRVPPQPYMYIPLPGSRV